MLLRGPLTDRAQKLWHFGLRGRTVAAQVLAVYSEFVEYPLVLLIADFGIRRRLDSRIGTRGYGFETDAADIEIFLEAIELQEVGELQSADISALSTDFLLEISDHSLQVCGREAGTEELIPERSRSKRRPRV